MVGGTGNCSAAMSVANDNSSVHRKVSTRVKFATNAEASDTTRSDVIAKRSKTPLRKTQSMMALGTDDDADVASSVAKETTRQWRTPSYSSASSGRCSTASTASSSGTGKNRLVRRRLPTLPVNDSDAIKCALFPNAVRLRRHDSCAWPNTETSSTRFSQNTKKISHYSSTLSLRSIGAENDPCMKDVVGNQQNDSLSHPELKSSSHRTYDLSDCPSSISAFHGHSGRDCQSPKTGAKSVVKNAFGQSNFYLVDDAVASHPSGVSCLEFTGDCENIMGSDNRGTDIVVRRPIPVRTESEKRLGHANVDENSAVKSSSVMTRELSGDNTCKTNHQVPRDMQPMYTEMYSMTYGLRVSSVDEEEDEDEDDDNDERIGAELKSISPKYFREVRSVDVQSIADEDSQPLKISGDLPDQMRQRVGLPCPYLDHQEIPNENQPTLLNHSHYPHFENDSTKTRLMQHLPTRNAVTETNGVTLDSTPQTFPILHQNFESSDFEGCNLQRTLSEKSSTKSKRISQTVRVKPESAEFSPGDFRHRNGEIDKQNVSSVCRRQTEEIEHRSLSETKHQLTSTPASGSGMSQIGPQRSHSNISNFSGALSLHELLHTFRLVSLTLWKPNPSDEWGLRLGKVPFVAKSPNSLYEINERSKMNITAKESALKHPVPRSSSTTVIAVTDIKDGSIADTNACFDQGDIIVEINGQYVLGGAAEINSVERLLAASGQQLHLALAKPAHAPRTESVDLERRASIRRESLSVSSRTTQTLDPAEMSAFHPVLNGHRSRFASGHQLLSAGNQTTKTNSHRDICRPIETRHNTTHGPSVNKNSFEPIWRQEDADDFARNRLDVGPRGGVDRGAGPIHPQFVGFVRLKEEEAYEEELFDLTYGWQKVSAV